MYLGYLIGRILIEDNGDSSGVFRPTLKLLEGTLNVQGYSLKSTETLKKAGS